MIERKVCTPDEAQNDDTRRIIKRLFRVAYWSERSLPLTSREPSPLKLRQACAHNLPRRSLGEAGGNERSECSERRCDVPSPTLPSPSPHSREERARCLSPPKRVERKKIRWRYRFNSRIAFVEAFERQAGTCGRSGSAS